MRKQLNDGTLKQVNQNEDGEDESAQKESWIPEKYQTNLILLFQLFLGATVAVGLDALTGVNYSLWALALGILGSYFGFYVGNIAERANSFGLLMGLLIAFVMSSMDDITPDMFTTYLPHVLLIMVIGIIGMIIGGYISSKLFNWDKDKSIPVALTALFGFPADFILCQEVSRNVGRNKQERELVFNEIMTPMLIGGFTTVTVASIVIASILVGTFS